MGWVWRSVRSEAGLGLLLLSLAACGGDAGVTVGIGGRPPVDGNGPEVGGTVRMPNEDDVRGLLRRRDLDRVSRELDVTPATG